MKQFLILLFCILTCTVFAQQDHGSLKITADGHFVQYADGTPFFWLGDTAWEMFHRLTLEEIIQYLDNRSNKGFNVVQAVLIAELDGSKAANKYGQTPLEGDDPNKPNDKYFQLVDTVVAIAASKGIVMALLPAWADKVTMKYGGRGPVIFNPENAFRFCKYLGERYKRFNNIVWVLGGDRPPRDDKDDWTPVYSAMAKGLDAGAGKHVLTSFHPGGYIWETSPMIHNEKWLDFNMIQSGHSEVDQPVWKNVIRDWNMKPVKPTIDAEPAYEDHPINPWHGWDPSKGYFREYEVRKQIYRSVFSGAFGVTYGHHAVWQFYNPTVTKINYADRYWYDALDRPAAFQAGYLKDLMLSRPVLNRIPDQSMIVTGQGTNNGEYITAFHDVEGSYAMVYLPVGKKLEVSTSWTKAKKLKAWWYNPRENKSQLVGELATQKVLSFTAPETGKEKDWVLVLDDASKKYSSPGAPVKN
jgi:hypothetical protein